MSNNNRICYTCGKAYRYCKSCEGNAKSPFWMNLVCSEECNEIFNVCAQYNLGSYSKAEARKKLRSLNAHKKQFASNSINNTIKTIFTKDKPQPVDTSQEDETSLSE